MRLYQDFYANFIQGDSGFNAMPQLIFVCEDEKNMVESFKTIVTNRLEIPQNKIIFYNRLKTKQ